ncbi:hypothetical protein HME9304_01379 [Flagellimonas maritima]|uniref:DUF6268 domain-containing protein n=1 Tax=Flagellimonas maritima TaxID=1383885 RepID=A0A2Z4LRP3_9FLAO|nr:DUF6268 family outer membrane beta-barrel protein [Allomuricauda aurantiaca]AWX44379.1 hypothetical protein HME9304_01379 [Allomuricauda aurantiaca]
MIRYFIVILFTTTASFAQMGVMNNPNEIEIAGLEYGYMPDLGGTEIRNIRANVNLAKPIGKSIIGLGLGYQNFDFTFNEATNVIDLDSYENMHAIRANLSFIRPLGNSWTFIASVGPTLMSNFGDGVSSEDFVFNILAGASKRWGDFDRNTMVMIGLLYGTQFGEPRFLPALSLRQKLNEHWSYSIGLPITSLNYQINDRHRLALLASPEGLFANNSDAVAVDGNRILTDTKLQFNGLNTRLAYTFRFAKFLAFSAEGGFIPAATLKVLDNENEDIYDLEPESGAYFRVGLKLLLNRKQRIETIKERNNED